MKLAVHFSQIPFSAATAAAAGAKGINGEIQNFLQFFVLINNFHNFSSVQRFVSFPYPDSFFAFRPFCPAITV